MLFSALEIEPELHAWIPASICGMVVDVVPKATDQPVHYEIVIASLCVDILHSLVLLVELMRRDLINSCSSGFFLGFAFLIWGPGFHSSEDEGDSFSPIPEHSRCRVGAVNICRRENHDCMAV